MDTNPRAFDVGELFILEALDTAQLSLVTIVLDFWLALTTVSHITRPYLFELDLQRRIKKPSERANFAIENGH